MYKVIEINDTFPTVIASFTMKSSALTLIAKLSQFNQHNNYIMEAE